MCARAARPAMGIATDLSFENKRLYRRFLNCFGKGGASEIESAVADHFDDAAKINASHRSTRRAMAWGITPT